MVDDLENYEITPEDLGCLGEREIDDGVVEEAVGSGAVEKKEVPKSFASIPFEVKKRARKLYDGFDQKDMPFEDFCTELYALESPALMQADLKGIIEQKHAGYQQKAAMDHAMKQNMN